MSSAATMPHATTDTPESLASQPPTSPISRRPVPRPLDIAAANSNDVHDLPSSPFSHSLPHPEKLARRESRLGLRNIFARTKSVRYPDSPTEPRLHRVARENPTQGVPYNTLPPGRPIPGGSISPRPLSTTLEDPEIAPEDSAPVTRPPVKRKPLNSSAKAVKAQPASWSSSPLHRAYAEAIRYSTLPATTISADLILKFHEKKAAEIPPTPIDPDAPGADDRAKSKKKRAKSAAANLELQWTNKTYILVTGGYLLEYPSDGPFDRLPDKVLRLTKDSAAFASDVIPGRHWVLQIASAVAADGTTAADPGKSFFSRFPFRSGAATATEKRAVSNMLLVFDSVEGMDAWLGALRSTIESLGGKKSLSETGKPKVDGMIPLRGQASQRTLVVRDRDMQQRWDPEQARDHDQARDEETVLRRGSDTSVPASDTQPDESTDDTSATNSVISHDGRQLESLRSSHNRLSCVSSGQRTIVTSAASSPACSPTTDTFPQTPDEAPTAQRITEPSGSEARLRPNATAILDRRQSLQTMSPFVEYRPAPARRPLSTVVGPQTNGAVNLQPNFSVPSSSSRRFSTRLATSESAPVLMAPPESAESFGAAPTRRPPTALQITRRLSMVEDQPSPKDDMPERPATQHGEKASPLEAENIPLPPSRPGSCLTDGDELSSPVSVHRSPLHSPLRSTQMSPRRLSSMGALRGRAGAGAWGSEMQEEMPPPPPKMRTLQPFQVRTQDPERCHSSTDMLGPGEGPAGGRWPRVKKRASMLPFVTDAGAVDGLGQQQQQQPLAPPPSSPLPRVPPRMSSGMRIRRESSAQTLPNRKSMPHLAEGPPPAPPPTCALPPIPPQRKKKATTLQVEGQPF